MDKWSAFSLLIVKLPSLFYGIIALAANKLEASIKCRLQFAEKLTSYREAIIYLNLQKNEFYLKFVANVSGKREMQWTY